MAEAIKTQKEAISLLSSGADFSEYERHLAEFEAAGEDKDD
jgi:hypothetical protein